MNDSQAERVSKKILVVVSYNLDLKRKRLKSRVEQSFDENMYRLIVLLFFVLPSVLGIKTFYDVDLETVNFFKNQSNSIDLCSELGKFYETRSTLMVLTRCIRFKSSQLLYCHGEMENYRNYSNKAKLERIESIVICNHNENDFHANYLRYFTKLKNLYIDKSSFQKFSAKMPKIENLSFINITGTQLRSIRSDFFSDLQSIQLIDLRHNQLSFIERLFFHANAHVKLYVWANVWNCTKNLKWIAMNDSKFEILDRNRLNCSDAKYRARPLLVVMTYKIQIHKACREDFYELRNCSCHISYLRFDDHINEFQPMYSVNCSGGGFYNFPSRLPDNTTTLFFSHNKISSLNMLCTRNSTYNNVNDIYVDYNQISDASVLDNCEWFLNFRVLSLKGNLLERIPNYAFKNSFEKSKHATKLYLSENPWLCSCRLQPRLLKLCQKYELIVDQKQIRCLSDKNDEHIYGRLLMELTKNDVCRNTEFPLNPYEIMSIVFALLIFLLTINLIYDYYLYKNFGKLPWVVMHTKFF